MGDLTQKISKKEPLLSTRYRLAALGAVGYAAFKAGAWHALEQPPEGLTVSPYAGEIPFSTQSHIKGMLTQAKESQKPGEKGVYVLKLYSDLTRDEINEINTNLSTLVDNDAISLSIRKHDDLGNDFTDAFITEFNRLLREEGQITNLRIERAKNLLEADIVLQNTELWLSGNTEPTHDSPQGEYVESGVPKSILAFVGPDVVSGESNGFVFLNGLDFLQVRLQEVIGAMQNGDHSLDTRFTEYVRDAAQGILLPPQEIGYANEDRWNMIRQITDLLPTLPHENAAFSTLKAGLPVSRRELFSAARAGATVGRTI